MAAKKTTGTGTKSAGTKKTTTAKSSGGTKSSGTGSKKTVQKKAPKTKAAAKPVIKEELVPELNNELVLRITLVVSVLLFLSNFRLSGKVGEVINQVTFGLFGVLAYVIPFFLFFGIAFYLANKKENKRYITKLVASVGRFLPI